MTMRTPDPALHLVEVDASAEEDMPASGELEVIEPAATPRSVTSRRLRRRKCAVRRRLGRTKPAEEARRGVY